MLGPSGGLGLWLGPVLGLGLGPGLGLGLMVAGFGLGSFPIEARFLVSRDEIETTRCLCVFDVLMGLELGLELGPELGLELGG